MHIAHFRSETRAPMPAQRPAEVGNGADEAQVGKRLREVVPCPAARARLHCVQPQVVGVAEHLLDRQPSSAS